MLTPLHAADRVMQVDAQLSLEESGRVGFLQWRESLPATLASDLEQRVRSWRFDPIEFGGRSVPAVLNLTGEIAANR